MKNLSIELIGEVRNSNFEEWKVDLLSRLEGVNVELATQDEFAEATANIKAFKSAEKALKAAKKSAINQAADINALFSAIDEVASQTRDVRLQLERQVKTRKAQIKQEHVDRGLSLVQDVIKQQGDDFGLLDHSTFLDSDIFRSAMKGKASTKGLDKAVKQTVANLTAKIEDKATRVKANAAVLDAQPSGYQVLFQDRANLLNLEKNDFDQLIDDRVERLVQQQKEAGAPLPGSDNTTDTDSEITLSQSGETGAATGTEDGAEDFELIVSIHAVQTRAEEIAKAIKEAYGEVTVTSFSRLHG